MDVVDLDYFRRNESRRVGQNQELQDHRDSIWARLSSIVVNGLAREE